MSASREPTWIQLRAKPAAISTAAVTAAHPEKRAMASAASSGSSSRRRRRTATISATSPPNQTAAAATWARSARYPTAAGDIVRVWPVSTKQSGASAAPTRPTRFAAPSHGRPEVMMTASRPSAVTSTAQPMPSATARASTDASVTAVSPRPVASAPCRGTCTRMATSATQAAMVVGRPTGDGSSRRRRALPMRT